MAPKFPVKTVSTFFGVGYLPLIPGTFGSLAGLIIYYYTKNNFIFYTFALVSTGILGFFSAGKAEKVFHKKDPRFVVIDEVFGMLLVFILLPYDPKLAVLGFFIFRVMDTLKPYPCNLIQNLYGSLGIMGDDIIAALYTGIILQVVFRLNSLRIP